MRIERLFAPVLAGIALALAAPVQAAGGSPGTGVAPDCDRACLTGVMNDYLAALVKHDPAGLPFDRDAKFTENTARLPVGKAGLWRSATAMPTTFRIYVADVPGDEIGFLGMMQAWGRPVLVAIRLKLQNGRIIEAEHITTDSLRPGGLKNLVTPRPEFAEDVPPAERSSRQHLVNIVDSYFEAAEHADGSMAPFAPHCVRHENGAQTTSNPTPVPWPVPLGSKAADEAMAYVGTLNCDAQLDTHVMDFIGRLWPRRIEVVDQQKGLVFAFPMFQHPGMAEPIKLVGVPGVDRLPLGRSSSNMQAGELFKIVNGQIVSVEAMGAFLPYGTKSGWGD